ncbi:MAG TPA: isochorismatase family protein [Dongiaceae bacterium]|jgi:nicotinamidase-related amidase|nr:isochorismatase family protein [Dongiaceae bacterium]
MRQSLAIDRRRAALILIDLQEEQRHVPEYAVEGLDTVLGHAGRLLAAARASGVMVIHTAFKRDFQKVPPRPLEFRAPDGGPAFSDKGSPLTAICREVEPHHGEPVLFKNDASAFCEGELEPLLRDAAVEWLIVAGVWTEACVAATVRDAIARGIRVLLVKDACGSGTRAMHQTGILNLANRLCGGAVSDTAAAARLIMGDVAEVWVPQRPVPILFSYADAEKAFETL